MKNCPYCAEEIQDEALKCKHCGEFLNQSGTPTRLPTRQLTRSVSDTKLSGVCGGIAEYAQIDPTLVRLLVVLAILATGILPGVIAYIVCALVVPPEGSVS